MCHMAGRLRELDTLAGDTPLAGRRRVAGEDADRQVAVDEDERQRVGPRISGTEYDAPILDPYPLKKFFHHGLRTAYEFHEIDSFGDDVILGLVDDQSRFEVVDIVVVEKIILLAEVHDDAGHLGFRQYGLEHQVDEAVPVLAVQQARDDRILWQHFPPRGAVVLERQDERACVIAPGPLLQRIEIDPVGPVAAGIHETVRALVGEKELVLADIRFDRHEGLDQRLVGKSPRQRVQLIFIDIAGIFLARTAPQHHRGDQC